MLRLFTFVAIVAAFMSLVACQGEYEHREKRYRYWDENGTLRYEEIDSQDKLRIETKPMRRIVIERQENSWHYYYETTLYHDDQVIDTWQSATLAESVQLVPTVIQATGWDIDETGIIEIQDLVQNNWIDPETAWHNANP